jgi:uncharacterized protein (DUF1800 family)
MAVFFTFGPQPLSKPGMTRSCVVALAITASVALTATSHSETQAIVHVLNRIGFGPRAGDVERVRAMGLDRYVDQQLHPDRIADAAMAARLSGLTTVGLSSREIAEQYEQPQLVARRERRQNAKQDDPAAGNPKPADPLPQRANAVMVELSEEKLLRAVYSERQLQEVLADFWFNHFNVDARKGPDRFLLTEYERETIRPHVLGKFRDLLGATAKSPAMLFYLDNWMSADPNGPHIADAAMGRRRNVGRPFQGRRGEPAAFAPPALRRAPEARSEIPGERSGERLALRQAQAKGRKAPRGLNENYGRELMELHTLGVDGGYTQKDVTEVARAFTGWTIENPRQGGGFKFEARIHDPDQKVVLGHVIKAGGAESDGEQVLDILAKHPSTATFISTKLARRFVSDTPPPALIERVAARFRETDGDLREVMRTILTSREFVSPQAYRAKVKTPFEFVASAFRATGADVPDARPLVRDVQQLGMPLYMCQPPTGYKDTGDAWVNTGALVNRMNFALRLADRVGAGREPPPLPLDSQAIIARVLSGDVSDTTRATIAKATTAPQMMALTLGSPEFQRR